MEVTSFCILMNMFIMLIEQTEHSYTAQKIERLQFFEYESVTVQCKLIDGVNAWRVMRELHKARSTNSSDPCSSPASSCTIKPALERHSGEYWCENDEGKRSGAVNISVTASLVILEIPTQPVVEGSDVTVPCIHKETELIAKLKTELNHIRDFYKNGFHLMTCYSSNMAILNVTKADEGYYKCSISGAGESPESWLAVSKPLTAPNEESPPVHIQQSETVVLKSAVRAALLALLSAVIGVILYKIKQGSNCFFSGGRTHDSQQAKTGFPCLLPVDCWRWAPAP
ncbi:hypothetical protein CRENBAI_006277 [Crenichthys baileyi]|uniref:Immunoglobulin domain-containing protein n=1 Tax=Crenichthys baileyi TaxID=28760 RepID=A0AAV9S0F2_9TELE